MVRKKIDSSVIITFVIAALIVIVSYAVVNYYSDIQQNGSIDKIRSIEVLW